MRLYCTNLFDFFRVSILRQQLFHKLSALQPLEHEPYMCAQQDNQSRLEITVMHANSVALEQNERKDYFGSIGVPNFDSSFAEGAARRAIHDVFFSWS